MRRAPLAFLGLLLTAAAAGASVAPTTPTFFLAWGTNGSAPGQLNHPRGVARDAAGNIYVCDLGNSRVQEFDNSGHWIRQWGSAGAGDGQFSGVAGIALDAAGNVFVADGGNNRVQKFTSGGVFVTKWGSFGTGTGQFSTPQGIATDAAGNVYVSDFSNRIQKFAGSGSFVLQWGSLGAGNGQFNFPTGVATDTSGNVYVVELNNHRLQKFTSAGTYLTQWGTNGTGNGQFASPRGVAIDDFGNVYVGDSGNNRVQKFARDGTYLTQWGTSGPANGQFATPAEIAIDQAGNVYVADIFNNRVQKFSGAGAPLSQAPPAYAATLSSYGTGAGQLSGPWGVASDSAGYIYVADESNDRIQKFNAIGAYVGQWGSFGSANGLFANPRGVATDGAGNVYVADTDNNRIQKFTSSGTFLTRWGLAGSGNGNFNTPLGVAVDVTGNVYVADYFNNRIQKFDPAGTYILQWGTAGSGNGQFAGPWDVATDPGGNVYVIDFGNSRVQRFTGTGVYVTQWGSAGIGVGQFGTPRSLTTDGAGDVYVSEYGNNRVQKFHGDGTYLATIGSPGTGNGQFQAAAGIDVDPFGNLYVVDNSPSISHVVKFVAPPTVAQVLDVGHDQGGQTRLRIRRASSDAPSAATITGYAVYRRVDALTAATSAQSASALLREGPATPASVELAGWDYLGTQPAAGDAEYSMVVPTLANANVSSVYYSAFMVRALTVDPLTHFDSAPEYGYSIDNLSPPAPTPFTANYVAASTNLHWGVSSARDFATFRLYRGSNAGFTPGGGNLVAATTDTGYVDPAPAGSYYKLSAVDLNGNESAFALVGPGQTTDVGAGPAVSFALEPVRPNPTTGRSLELAFVLPTASPARLELIDVMGRLVVRREVGALGAGRHVVSLTEDRRLAPGMYMVRLSQGANAQVTRIAVLN